MSSYEILGTPQSGLAAELSRQTDAPAAYVADLSTTSVETIRDRNDPLRPVVLLAPTAKSLAALVGIGVDCQGAVWHPGRDGGPDQLVFVPTPEADITTPESARADVEKPGEPGEEPSGQVTEGDDPLAPMRGADLAALLDAAVRSPMRLADQGPKVDPIPPGVAGKQVVLSPTPFTYHPKTYTWAHSRKPVVIKDQTATLALPLFAEIYASPNPANKFLRITAFGTGFSPGRMKWDNTGERGMYQDRMRTSFALVGAPAGTGLLMTAPKTQNGTATYTSSGSLTVGIKGGKESPEPSGSATISASVSSTLSDFKVLEKSAGLVAEWAFDMQLCGSKSDGQYDVNEPMSLVGWYGRVWEVPGLASSTLFPACMAAWSLPLSCQQVLTVRATLFQRLMYVASSWAEKMRGGCEMTKPFDCTVDFSAVNVEQEGLAAAQ